MVDVPPKFKGDDLPVEKVRMPLLYQVENQWGGDDAPWHNGGQWIIGGRSTQNVVELKVKSDDGGNTLNGTMTHEGEGLIGFKGTMIECP